MTDHVRDILDAQANEDTPQPAPHPLLQGSTYIAEPPPAYSPHNFTFSEPVHPVDAYPSSRLDRSDVAFAAVRTHSSHLADPELPHITTRTNAAGPIKFTMELHIVYRKVARKPAHTSTKAPLMLSSALDYEGFLGAIARAAEVRKPQVDRENLQWLPKKPVNGKPTAVSNVESYGIMLNEIRRKKENDRWVIIRMGKPLISDAVCLHLISP